MKMCLNWKVLVGLAELPLLLIAVCPLSMLVMAIGMGKMSAPARDQCSTQPLLAPETAIAFEDKTTQLRRAMAELDARRAEVAADLRGRESSSVARSIE